MPSHGRATADSHHALPVVTASADALADDLAPFRALAKRAPMAMTAHILFKAWDGQHPATLSPTIINNIIRGEIGFEGLLMSDDIAMKALSGSLPDRARAALAAGVDVVLHCSGKAKDNVALAKVLPPVGAIKWSQPSGNSSHSYNDLIAKRDALLALA
jgi:beta-N-acetylhexosaminidase